MNGTLRTVFTVVWIAALSAPTIHASDWQRWRGPDQDGTLPAEGAFGTDPFGLDVAWARPLGIAYSGIAVVDGRAVTMFGDGEFDWMTAVEAGTGKEIWRYKIAEFFPQIGGSEGGPVSMPVIDDGVVYGLGAKGHLFAVRLDSGEEIWSLRIDEELGARKPHFGFTTTPLVVGDLLFVQTGGDEGRSLAGFDKTTGKLRWSTGDDLVSYQSPILATLAGREQIVACTNLSVFGMVPDTGEVLWSHEHGTVGGGDGFATPVLLGDDAFLITGQQGSKAFRVAKSDGGYEVEESWLSMSLKRSLATPVLYEGRLYGFDGDFLTCVDPSSGDKIWKSRPPGGRGLILVDGHLVVFANDGSVVVAAASPEGYREKARVGVSETGSYTYPSFAGGMIFVRNTRDFAAVSVSEAAAVATGVDAGDVPPRNEFERWVRKVEASEDKRLLTDDFMATRSGFPIVEDGTWVHFVYRGEVDDVAITGSMTEFQVEEPLRRIEGTDLHYRSYEIEPGARWEYHLNVDFDNPQPDPLNPRRLPGEDSDLSELITAGWVAPDYVRPYDGTKRGRVESFTLASEILENERAVDVYLPPGYDEGGERYPLLVVNEGKDWLNKGNLPNALNHLIGRSVTPLIVAFVDAPGRTSRTEMGGEKSADYVRMLTDELVPQMDEKYRTLTDPSRRAILGSGGGALMAAYAAVKRPDVFGRSAACSAWMADPGATELTEAIENAEGDKAIFRIVWNRYELHRAEWNVDLGEDSRSLAESLEANGYEVEAHEVLDSSGWGGWRVRAGEVLEEFFPL